MRNNIRVFILFLFFVFFIVAVGGGLFWGTMNFVRQVPAGADFISLWKPSNNFIMEGIDPYAEWNSFEVQNLIYGHPARSYELSYLYNMPLYVVLLFFPIGWLGDLVIARTVGLVLLQVVTIGVVILAITLSRWKASWFYLLVIFLFSMFWLPAIGSLLSGNFVIIQSLLIFGAIYALQTDADELAGALAAFALVNLEVTGLAILVLAIWVFSSERWRVLAGFLMTMTLLVSISFLIAPGWILPFIRSILATWNAGFLPSTFHLLDGWFPGVGARLARSLIGLAAIVLVFEILAVRRKDPHWLYWTISLVAVLTPLFGMEFSPFSTVFSLPALILVLSVMERRWGLFGRLMALILLIAIFLGLWAAWLAKLDAVFIFIYPIFMAIMLYWVRWWATRPPRMWMDTLTQGY